MENHPTPKDGSWLRRLLPIAGISVVVVVVLAHLASGAALMHLGLTGDLANLGLGVLVIGLAVFVTVKLLVVFGVQRWWRHQ
jgi:hypothetical protein